MVFTDEYECPDTAFVKKQDYKRPLFTSSPIGNPRRLAPKLPEPISAEDLDVVHALRRDAGNCPCIDDWAEDSMFERDPSNKPTFPADNSDIDDFLREYRESKESVSKSVENLNNTSGHSSSTAGPSAAPNNSNGFATSNKHIGTMQEDFRAFATLENTVMNRPVQNGANIRGPMVYGYPQRGYFTVTPDKAKKRVSKPKVLRSPSVYPKSQIAATPTKANLQVHLGAPELSPLDGKQAHHHKMGKSNPVSRKWATEAKATPSIPTGEPSSRPSNADTEGVSSTDSDTTSITSSKSRENSGSSDSTVSDTPKGPPPAPEDPPAPTSGGYGTRSNSAVTDRAANGKNSTSGVAAKRSAYRERYMSRSKSCPCENSNNPKGYRTRGRYLGFLVASNNTSGVKASLDGLEVRNGVLCQNGVPLAIMDGVIGFSADNAPLAPYHLPPLCGAATNSGSMYGSTTHNGPAMQNGSIQTYGPPMQNGPLPQSSAAVQNGPMPMPQNTPPTYGYQTHAGLVPPFVASMQSGPVPATSKKIPLMRNDHMPPYATPMKNSAVPLNSYLMPNGPMPLNIYPMLNSPMPPYILPIQNGPVPQYGHPIQNGQVPAYPPMPNAPMPPYGHPMQNGAMPGNNAPMQNGHMPAYGAPVGDRIMPVYDPPMQNPLRTSNGGNFVSVANAYISIAESGFPDHVFNVQAPNGQSLNVQAPNGQAPDVQAPDAQAPDAQAPNVQDPNETAPPRMPAPSGQVLNVSVFSMQASNGDDNNGGLGIGPRRQT